MTRYDITIKGYKSGLTENAVRQMVEDTMPNDVESVKVEPSEEE